MIRYYSDNPLDSLPDERNYFVHVTITREYTGTFYGTRIGAERLAREFFKRNDECFLEETIISNSKEEELHQ